jgi:hypothetical protein
MYNNISTTKEALIKAIHNSKQDKSFESVTASSNAITILVGAKHSFSGEDLKGISIKSANIRNGMFNGTDMTNSDLTDVVMINTKLAGANLTGAILQGINLGIYPDLVGHNSFVNSVAISNDSKIIVTGSGDNTAKVWDAESGKKIADLVGHNRSVYSVAISNDSKIIVTGSGDNTAKVWDAESGKKIADLVGHNRSVYSVAISNDSKIIVTGSGDNTAKTWLKKDDKWLLYNEINAMESALNLHEAKVDGAINLSDVYKTIFTQRNAIVENLQNKEIHTYDRYDEYMKDYAIKVAKELSYRDGISEVVIDNLVDIRGEFVVGARAGADTKKIVVISTLKPTIDDKSISLDVKDGVGQPKEQFPVVNKVKEVPKADVSCSCLIFMQDGIKYDNPLLNNPDLLESLLTKYSLSQILDLSSNLDESLINEVLNTNNPDTLLAGLMSVDNSSYDF